MNDLASDAIAWLPDAQVEAMVAGIFYEDLPALSVDELSEWLAHRLELRVAEHSYDLDLYTDALFDLSQLAEEFRFQATAGALYSLGLQDQIAAATTEESVAGAGIAVPTVVRALLAGTCDQRPRRALYCMILASPSPDIGYLVVGGQRNYSTPL